MRRAARLDGNHKDVVDALTKIGATVQSLASMHGGVPDLLVGYHGKNVLLEVKDGSLVPSARTLTVDELQWQERWGGQVKTVGSPEEAQRVVIDVCLGTNSVTLPSCAIQDVNRA